MILFFFRQFNTTLDFKIWLGNAKTELVNRNLNLFIIKFDKKAVNR
jgi:hypothetical protein